MLVLDIISEKATQDLGKSAEMQAGFQQIARWLIDAWTQRIVKHIRGDLRYPLMDIYQLAAGSVEETFKHGKHLKKLPPPLRAFIQHVSKRSLILRAESQNDGTTTRRFGEFSPAPGAQPIITLYFDQEAFEATKQQIAAGNGWQVYNLLSTRRDTLVHELIHAYDDYTSAGKYTAAAKKGIIATYRPYGAPPPTDEEKAAAHDRYLQFPHEINARFGQTVARLNTHSYATWQEYVYEFKMGFYGWHLMPPEVKRRLLVRLGMLWTAEQKQQAIDIKPYVQKMNDRLRQTFPDVWVSPAHGNIEIRDLDKLPPKDQTVVMDKVCRLADIFQRQVITYDAVPMLRGFGFVANKGRNKDYRISTRFRRPAKVRA